MQVSVESPGQIERRLTVIVPAEKWNEAFDKRIASVAKSANIAGFRKGKAPLTVIKQRYGDSARQEALSDVIQTSLYDALHQEKLTPVGVPTVEPKAILPDQPIEFIATFEVLPDMDGLRFDLAAIEKQVATITEEDIQRVIDHLRGQQTNWNKVDRSAKEKDQVVIDFAGSLEGVPFEGGKAENYPIILGSNTMIPGFEDGVLGMKAGDEKVIDVTFPTEYFAKDLAGKAAQFALKAISVSEPELPELNDTFIKKLGIKSGELSDLQAEIRKNLERELERVIQAKLKAQIFDQLLAQNTLEIPKALIEREANRIHDEVHPHHGHSHSHTEAEMAEFNTAAKRNVALGLLMGEAVRRHNISADKNRVQAHLAKLVGAYENPGEVLEWYAKNKRAYAEIEMQILEQQVIEALLKEVTVTEKMLAYNELIKNG